MEVSNLGYALRWRFLLILVLVPALLQAEQRAASRQALLFLTGIAGLYGAGSICLESAGLASPFCPATNAHPCAVLGMRWSAVFGGGDIMQPA